MRPFVFRPGFVINNYLCPPHYKHIDKKEKVGCCTFLALMSVFVRVRVSHPHCVMGCYVIGAFIDHLAILVCLNPLPLRDAFWRF